MGKEKKTFFHDLLTSGLERGDPETLRRIRLLNTFFVVFLLAAPLLGVFYLSSGSSFLFNASMVGSVFSGIGILLLRKTRNIKLCSNYAIFLLWAFLLLVRWETGAMAAQGLLLLTWIWNGVLILAAIYVTGYFWGALWSCVIFLESGLAAYLYMGGDRIPGLFSGQTAALYGLGGYLLGLLAILAFAFLFEKERSETKEREEEKGQIVQESRRYIDEILSKSPVPTFVIDRNHRVIQWNRACEEFTGIPANEVIGKRPWEGLFLDEEGTLADKIIDDPGSLLSGGHFEVLRTESGSFSVEAYLPQLGGGVKALMKASPILDQDGAVKGAIQCIQEVRDGDGAADTGAFRLQYTSWDALPCPVYVIDTKGKISSWNEACERKLGFTSELVIGKSPLSIVAKPYRVTFREVVIRVLKGDSFAAREWKYYSMDGDPVYVRAELYPLKDSSGNIQGCVVVNTDITDLRVKLKLLERALGESKERLKELTQEYELLKKNIASFIRKRDEKEPEGKESGQPNTS